jgi:hypothetical protein
MGLECGIWSRLIEANQALIRAYLDEIFHNPFGAIAFCSIA